jgi:hypothetical protein
MLYPTLHRATCRRHVEASDLYERLSDLSYVMGCHGALWGARRGNRPRPTPGAVTDVLQAQTVSQSNMQLRWQ